MAETGHTPWRWEFCGTGGRWILVKATGEPARVSGPPSADPSRGDMGFVTRAINSHADMLDALKRAEATLEIMGNEALRCGLEGTKDWDEVAGGSDMHGSLDVIRAAIARAENGGDHG